MSRSRTSGFTLVEMAVVILIFGLLFAFSIPAYQSINGSFSTQGGHREPRRAAAHGALKAMASGMDQPMHFTPNYLSSDYHIHYASGFIPAKWKFPRGITYYSIGLNPTMKSDGRSDQSGLVILQDMKGNLDTVSVLTSGLVLVK